jgi:hypothetical protein
MSKETKSNYWEEEKPLNIKEGSLQLKFYDKADALSLKMFYYDSEKEQATDSLRKNISLRKKYLQQSPEILLTLKELFAEWYDDLEAQN